MTTIEVNEKTKVGKALIETAQVMAEKHKGIKIIHDGDEDDSVFLKKMLKARKSGLIDREIIMSTLNDLIEK
jgi:hypothetical protein